MRPSGVTTIAEGREPTRIGLPALPDAARIGVTVPEPEFTTYAVRPSGVTAIATGCLPTRIGRSGTFVASRIGVTVSDQ
jgi:hypothetical protein